MKNVIINIERMIYMLFKKLFSKQFKEEVVSKDLDESDLFYLHLKRKEIESQILQREFKAMG